MNGVRSVRPYSRLSLLERNKQLLLENRQLRQQVVLLRGEARLARIDLLTGLDNRRGLLDKLSGLIDGAYRHHRSLAVALIDVDHFKIINDRLDHEAGDRALKLIAKAIQSVLRPSDVAGRYGGDELAVILDQSAFGQAFTPLERIRTAVSQLQVRGEDGKVIPLSISVGFTTLKADPASTWIGEDQIASERARLLKEADDALSLSKRQGRNQVNEYRPDLKTILAALKRTRPEMPAMPDPKKS